MLNELIDAIAAANEAMAEYAKAQPDARAGIGSAEFKKAEEAFLHANAECAKAYSSATTDAERTTIEQLTVQLMDEHARKVLRLDEVEILQINADAEVGVIEEIAKRFGKGGPDDDEPDAA